MFSFYGQFSHSVNCKLWKVNCAKKVVTRASVFPSQKSGLPSSEKLWKKITTLCKKVRRTKWRERRKCDLLKSKSTWNFSEYFVHTDCELDMSRADLFQVKNYLLEIEFLPKYMALSRLRHFVRRTFLHKVVIFLCTFSEEGRPDFRAGKTEARFTTFFAQLTFKILQLTL